MTKYDIMGTEIWVCPDDGIEARQLWKDFPKDRHRIWKERETWKYCLAAPEELQVVLDAKLKKPAEY